MMDLLDSAAVSFTLVLTKIDKLAVSRRASVLEAIDKEARGRTAAFPEVCATSSFEQEGLDPLKTQIAALAAS